MVYKLNFASNTSHSFTHRVNGVNYLIQIRYDIYADNYLLSVNREVNSRFENIINSIRITTGINLFLQFSYYNLGDFRVVPFLQTLFDKIPTSSTIQNYFIIWEHD